MDRINGRKRHLPTWLCGNIRIGAGCNFTGSY